MNLKLNWQVPYHQHHNIKTPTLYYLKCFLLGRDNQIMSLQGEINQLNEKMRNLKSDLSHKENSIDQLKSQLEYQCLGISSLYITLFSPFSCI